MRDAWHDEGFARRWDSEDALRTNPDRGAQIALLVALVAESWRDGDRLLDLGIGSGLVEEALFARLPGIRVVGVDHSEAMLAQARVRHRGRSSLRLVEGGFEDLDALDALGADGTTAPPFEFVICVQALHEVVDDVKRAVFAFVRRRIAPGGLFLVLDRFDYEPFALAPEYRCIWNRLSRGAAQGHPAERLSAEGCPPEGRAAEGRPREGSPPERRAAEGRPREGCPPEGRAAEEQPAAGRPPEGHVPETPLSFEDYRTRYAAKTDHVGRVEDYVRWMREAGFDAACLYQQFNRAVIAARPKAV